MENEYNYAYDKLYLYFIDTLEETYSYFAYCDVNMFEVMDQFFASPLFEFINYKEGLCVYTLNKWDAKLAEELHMKYGYNWMEEKSEHGKIPILLGQMTSRTIGLIHYENSLDMVDFISRVSFEEVSRIQCAYMEYNEDVCIEKVMDLYLKRKEEDYVREDFKRKTITLSEYLHMEI